MSHSWVLEFLEVISEAMKPGWGEEPGDGCVVAVPSPSPSAPLTQDVVVPQQHGVVDLGLAEPRLLIPGGEDLDGHVLPVPNASPHLAVAPFACRDHGAASHGPLQTPTLTPCQRYRTAGELGGVGGHWGHSRMAALQAPPKEMRQEGAPIPHGKKGP